MTHLQPQRTEANGNSETGASDPTVLEVPARPPRSQPLGVLLVCRYGAAWHRAAPEKRRPFNLDDPRTLKTWEKKIESRIYRIYGYNENEKNPWEFFALLEFGDLQTWNRRQQSLDTAGFSTYFEWDILAFGRRLGQE